MKTVTKIFIFILGFILLLPFSQEKVQAINVVDIYFFYDEVCSHCYQESLYLDELELESDNLQIHKYEITGNVENNQLFEKVKLVFGETEVLTPYTVIGGVSLVGFNDQTKNNIEKLILRYANKDFVNIVKKVINNEVVLESDFDTLNFEQGDVITLPLIGEVRIDSLSLFVAGIVIGFVDGFNPCAMWVLIFLITMLLNTKDKKRIWIIGLTFLFTSAFVYFLMMIAWLNIAIQFSAILWIRILIGIVALCFGSYNIYQFYKLNKKPEIGCEVTSPVKKKKMIEKIKVIVTEKSLLIALVGVVVLAISVNMVELACSAGLPLLYTQILAYNDLSNSAYFFYILLYILFFLLDDLIIFAIAMVTLKVTGISNKYTKFSHIIGGIIMIAIGILLIFFPEIIMFNF